MKASVQLIGPEDAKQLLAENQQMNRPLSKRRVAKYAKDMKEGRWRESGSSISVFYGQDRIYLLNGQHRLTALIEAGIEMKFVIVEEDTLDVFSVFDIGGNRSTANILSLAGYTNTNVLQALARIVINYDRYNGQKEPWDKVTITPPETLDWCADQDPKNLQMVFNAFSQAHRALPATNTWYAGISYLILRDSEQNGEWLRFHEGYHTGANLEPGSPILALRQYTINRSRLGERYTQTNWDRQAHVGVGLRAWNDWLKGRSVGHYRFTKQSLPMPVVL